MLPTPSENINAEVRRLLLERAAKKRELDELDKTIESLFGINGDSRPKKPRMSAREMRRSCGLM